MAIYNTREIMDIIPHRYPFLLILSLPEWKGHTAYFAGIDRAKFRRKVVPGDVLMLETEIIKMKGAMGVGRARAFVDGKAVAEAELTFAVGK